jgi:DNA primase
MPLSQKVIDEVRSQSDIVRVVSDYLALKKRGASYIACCPFHQEKTPSFNVHPTKQVFKCFGCGVGGNVFTFVMKADNVTFSEAVRIVADKCGVPLPEEEERTPDERREEIERERLLQLNEWAAQFFESRLADDSEGRAALDYLRARGLEDATMRTLRIGYAPDRWDALSGFLRRRGATTHEIERSGLVTIKDSGSGFYDRFRGRVMFPVADAQGRIIAFGGRVLDDGEPKYLNSPETPVYVKGKHLFGLHLAKDGMRKLGYAVVVEGYLDFIIPFQAGVPNVVASLGTALTDAQVRQMRRYLDNPRVVVNFDADAAGQSATRRSFELFLEHGFKVNVLRLPDGKDPDGFIRANGATAYRELLKNSQPLLDYLANVALFEFDVRRPAGKAAAVNAVLPYLVCMRDPIERSVAAERLADRLQLDDRLIREELRKSAAARKTEMTVERVAVADSLSHAERQVLVAMLSSAELRERAVAALSDDIIRILPGRIFFWAVRDAHGGGRPFGYGELCAAVARRHHAEACADETGQIDFLAEMDERVFSLNAEMENMVATLMLEAEAPTDDESFRIAYENLQSGLDALERRRVERETADLHVKVREADRAGDYESAVEHAARKLELRKRELAMRLERMKKV